jgi:hypothetical protein
LQEFLFERFEKKRTLITGEASSGKTKVTASLLREALSKREPLEITVLDFAPGQRTINGLRIGGQIAYFLPNPECRVYEPSATIRAPRLEGHHAAEVLKLAEDNAVLTSALLRQYLALPTSCLFINDLTIHLHAGDPNLLLEAIRRSETFIGNAYTGSSLAPDQGSGLSGRERELLQRVVRFVDLVIELPSVRIGGGAS